MAYAGAQAHEAAGDLAFRRCIQQGLASALQLALQALVELGRCNVLVGNANVLFAGRGLRACELLADRGTARAQAQHVGIQQLCSAEVRDFLRQCLDGAEGFIDFVALDLRQDFHQALFSLYELFGRCAAVVRGLKPGACTSNHQCREEHAQAALQA